MLDAKKISMELASSSRRHAVVGVARGSERSFINNPEHVDIKLL
jgi:hypothetical protein